MISELQLPKALDPTSPLVKKPLDKSTSLAAKTTTIAGGLLLVGAASLVSPPLGLGLAVAGFFFLLFTSFGLITF